MINTELLLQTINERHFTLETLSSATGIPVDRLNEIVEEGDPNGIEIQTISTVLKMPVPLRRKVWFNTILQDE